VTYNASGIAAVICSNYDTIGPFTRIPSCTFVTFYRINGIPMKYLFACS